MTEQEQKAFDQMRDALESVAWHGGGGCWIVNDDKIEAALTAANAVSHPQATEPAGWKLVPVEPTPEMLGCIVHSRYPEDWHAGKALQMNQRGESRVPFKTEYEIAVGQYQRMLAAAPEAP